MPNPTRTEVVVTRYVYGRFEGTGYSTYPWNGGTVYTFENAPRERWFDTDNDGYFDYGRRNEGNGVWSTFRENGWQSDYNPPARDPRTEEMEEVVPEFFNSEQSKLLDTADDFFPAVDFFPSPSSPYPIDMSNVEPTIATINNDWSL